MDFWKFLEGGETMNYNNQSYDYDALRDKLNGIIESGLALKAIAQNIGISENNLSRFRNYRLCLRRADAELLSNYLDKIVIPKHF